MSTRKLFCALALAAAFLGTSGQNPANAQASNVVTLQSTDGFTQLRGNLLGFENGTYTIETVLGVIQVDALQVNCEGEACPDEVLFGAKFDIHGSRTIGAELMPALLEGYADSLGADFVLEVGQNPDARTARIILEDGRSVAEIELLSKGSSSGYAGLGGQDAQIAMSSRRMTDADLAALAPGGVGDLRDSEFEHVIGLDGLIAIVHPTNPLSSVSLEELALIFSGNITNWSQLGGPNADINLYTRDDASATFQTFGSLILSPFGVDITGNAQRFVNNAELSDTVASDPFGIGVTGTAHERAARALPIRQDCGLLSYPTTFAMKAEEYPLSRRLYLYTTPTGLPAHAKRLVEFAASAEAHSFVIDAGFVDQSLEQARLSEQGERLVHGLAEDQEAPINELRALVQELRDAQRVSITLRFAPGGAQLTKKSQEDLARLARLVAEGRFGDKEIMLVGFTDSIGPYALNRALSQRRATTIEAQLRGAVPPGALDGINITALGFGEMLPVGCNTNPQGRGANRRVEVWLRG